MKASTWLKIYCLEKREMINEVASKPVPSYVTDEDLHEIDSWGESYCRQIIAMIKEADDIDDGRICPWCRFIEIQYNTAYPSDFCDECGYGDRHGVCDSDESDYQKIRHALPQSRIWMSFPIDDLPVWDYPIEGELVKWAAKTGS